MTTTTTTKSMIKSYGAKVTPSTLKGESRHPQMIVSFHLIVVVVVVFVVASSETLVSAWLQVRGQQQTRVTLSLLVKV